MILISMTATRVMNPTSLWLSVSGTASKLDAIGLPWHKGMKHALDKGW